MMDFNDENAKLRFTEVYQKIGEEFGYKVINGESIEAGTHKYQNLADKIKAAIGGGSILIADFSPINKNVMWECGYAEGIGKQVLLVKMKNDDTESFPSMLDGRNPMLPENNIQLEEGLRALFKTQIENNEADESIRQKNLMLRVASANSNEERFSRLLKWALKKYKSDTVKIYAYTSDSIYKQFEAADYKPETIRLLLPSKDATDIRSQNLDKERSLVSADIDSIRKKWRNLCKAGPQIKTIDAFPHSCIVLIGDECAFSATYIAVDEEGTNRAIKIGRSFTAEKGTEMPDNFFDWFEQAWDVGEKAS